MTLYKVVIWDYHDNGRDKYEFIIPAISSELAVFHAASKVNISDPDDIQVTEFPID